MSEYSTYDLERMVAGEIETPPDAAEQVASLQRENDDVLQRYPVETFVPRIVAGAPQRRSIRAPVVLTLAGLTALLLVTLWPKEVVRAPRPTVGPGEPEPGVRLKGPEVRLSIYKAAGRDGEVLMEPGDSVGAGDLVQAKFGVAEPSWIALFSVDGTGVVTPIEPPTLQAEAVRYEGGSHAAPTATELDDAPRFERFFVVACPARFAVREIVDTVKDGGTAPGCEVETVELKKR